MLCIKTSNWAIGLLYSFYFQVPMLSDLNLSDNLMGKIPFISLENVNSLQRLDLSNNRIEKIEDQFSKMRLKLDVLLLNENNLESLNEKAFQNFIAINYTR